jgi:hypothetical protein
MSTKPAEATRRFLLAAVCTVLAIGTVGRQASAGTAHSLPNNFPFLDHAGTAATFSTAGFVDLDNEFHVPQGSNGRSCETCHLAQAGWSIRPVDVELRFFLTQGTDPIFNLLDADNPNADVSTPQARFAAYSMLRKGLFRRGGNVPANAEYEIIAVDDPLGAGGSLTRFQAFRRPLATGTSTSPGTSAGTTRTPTARAMSTRGSRRRPRTTSRAHSRGSRPWTPTRWQRS